MTQRQQDRQDVKSLLSQCRAGTIYSPIAMLGVFYRISMYLGRYHPCFRRRSVGALARFHRTWRMVCAISINDMLKIYDRLNVKLGLGDICGESFYAGVLPITQAELDWAEGVECLAERIFAPRISNEIIDNDGNYVLFDRD